MTETKTNLFWSGPGRALQAHLALFDRVGGAAQWMRAHHGRAIPADEMPSLVMQRCMLLSSMSYQPTLAVFADGTSTATQRDDYERMFDQSNVIRAAGLIGTEYALLNEGETHYVSHHVATTIEDAAESAPNEALFDTDLPCPSGLIVLEYPLIIDDLHPETGEVVKGLSLPIRAIGWRTSTVMHRDGDDMVPGPGIAYVLYLDSESYNAIHLPAADRVLGAPEGMRRASDMADTLEMWASDFSGWGFGLPWSPGGIGPRDEFPVGEVHDTVARIRRWLWTYFRFTFSRIIMPTPGRLSRPESRRAERAFARKPPEDGYVKIIRLRREVEAEERGERGDGYAATHQWWVRRHWVYAFHPKLGGPCRLADGTQNPLNHRWVVRDAHIAGNPFGPLVIGHNVSAAVR